jgi:hypothetical protein
MTTYKRPYNTYDILRGEPDEHLLCFGTTAAMHLQTSILMKFQVRVLYKNSPVPSH